MPVPKVEVLTDKLEQPWALAVLDNGDMLITEKMGNLRLLGETGLSGPVSGVPSVYSAGQGGLLDVKIVNQSPEKAEILLSLASGTKSSNALTVVSATLVSGATPTLRNVQTVFQVTPVKDTPVHYGGRMLPLPDNTLLLTSGDGFDYRESAQVKDSLLGKIIRINQDGSIPADNPFVEYHLYHSAVFTLGHRNPQALAFDASRNWIVAHEHGPAGGDEINILNAGNNYGWPVVTNGKDYSGANITPFTEYEGMEPPFLDWTPSIAPSDMLVYTGELFPEFKNDYLVTTLKTKEVLWVSLEGNKVVSQQNILPDYKERYRGIAQDLDGAILLLTDSGKLLKITR